MTHTSSESQCVSLIAVSGGGILSSKGEVTDVLGERIPALHLRVIPPAATAPEASTVVDLAFARKLSSAPNLSPSTLAEALSTHMLEPGAAAPPLAALVHAMIPAAVVIECYTPAISGNAIVLKDLQNFALQSVAITSALAAQPDAAGIYIEGQGALAWGNTIGDAAAALRKMLANAKQPPAEITASVVEEARAELLRLLPAIRGLLVRPPEQEDGPHTPVITRALCNPEVLAFLNMKDARAQSDALPLCQAHARYLGSQPLWLEIGAAEDSAQRHERFYAALTEYLEAHAGVMPRVVLLPGLGAMCAGDDARDAYRAGEVLLLSLAALRGGAAVGSSARTVVQEQPATVRQPLQGRVAVVTGAAGAIGAGICRGLLLQGCHIAATDLPGERLDALVNELSEIDASRVIGLPLDVTDADSVAQGVAKIVETWGGVDIAIINAGVAHVSPLAEMDLDAFRRLERINVEGALLLLRAMANHFGLQGSGGDIVMVSTKNVFSPGATFGAYSATKAAAHQLARIASLELAGIDVRVNMVAPDAVFSDHGTRKSGLWQEVGPSRMRARGLDEKGLEDYYRSRNQLKARITPDHVANAVLFFVTRQTPTTGATLPVDGGLPDAVPR